jgi:5-oxoprolinase (ATP-hydrolysing) subunit A
MRTIDLNSDLGEGFGSWRAGDDAAMLAVVTSANIACGGHAGDPDTMVETLTLARQQGVVVGAHPGYADRAGFGRRVIPCTMGEIERFVAVQVGSLMGAAALAGTPVKYVKPHGALGNLAAADRSVADAIARAVAAVARNLSILAISGTELQSAADAAGLEVYSEIFADRAYLPTGHLVPRSHTAAMIKDPDEAASRLVAFLRTGSMPTLDGPPIALQAHSVCVHGDSAGAVSMARIIRQRLTAEGFTLAPFLSKDT